MEKKNEVCIRILGSIFKFCEFNLKLLRRTKNSLRVGDELQERRNTAVSLLISAGGGAFQMV